MLRRYTIAGIVILTALAVAVCLRQIPLPAESAPVPRIILQEEGLAVGGSSLEERLPSAVAASPPERIYEDVPTVPEPQAGYYIKDWGGRISIIREGEDTPEMIFDIYTRFLPAYDQEQLQKGLYVASYQELTSLIEDYIS